MYPGPWSTLRMCSRCVSILSSLLFPLPLVISPFGLALLHFPTKNSMLIQIMTVHVTTWTTFSGMHTEEGGTHSVGVAMGYYMRGGDYDGYSRNELADDDEFWRGIV